jgi:hypothetical protein
MRPTVQALFHGRLILSRVYTFCLPFLFDDVKMSQALEEQFRSFKEFEIPNHLNDVTVTLFHVPRRKLRFFPKMVINKFGFSVISFIYNHPSGFCHYFYFLSFDD